MACANGQPYLPDIDEAADFLVSFLTSSANPDRIAVEEMAGLHEDCVNAEDFPPQEVLHEAYQMAHERLHPEGSIWYSYCLEKPCREYPRDDWYRRVLPRKIA